MYDLYYAREIDHIQFQKDLMEFVISTNVQYLSISVSIILGAGLLFTILLYFTSFRPLLKKLKAQEDIIVQLSSNVEAQRSENLLKFNELSTKQMESLAGFTKQFEKLKIVQSEELKRLENKVHKSIDLIDKKTARLEILEKWNLHYVWMAHKLPENTLSTLNSCIFACLAAGEKEWDWMIKMCLESIIDQLELIQKQTQKEIIAAEKRDLFNELDEISEMVTDPALKIMTEKVQEILGQVRVKAREKA